MGILLERLQWRTVRLYGLLPFATNLALDPVLTDLWKDRKGALGATHFWDCNGAACDEKTVQPWEPSFFRYAAHYAPVDPKDFGGPAYGEVMWLTGAASDA